MQRVTAIATGPSVCLSTLVAITLIWVGIDQGGYFPPVWGWTGLAFAWVAAVAFVLRDEIVISRLELVFGGGLALVTAWSAVSLEWTPDVTVGVQNVERDLVYVGAALVALSLRDRLTAVALRNAALAGSSVICVYSLGTRLFPDRLGFYSDALTPGRLFNPLGYWNAQGTLAALSMLLAIGVIAGRGRTSARAVAAGLLPLLALDCYFTLSRGALIALVVGLAAWLAIDPARLRSSVWLLLAAPWPAIAVWRAHGMAQLFGGAFGLHSAPAGHRLAWQALACALAAAAAVGVLARIEGKLRLRRWVKLAYAGAWIAGAVVVVALAAVRYGTPADMARSSYDAFTAPPPSLAGTNRVLSLSLDNRWSLWSVAWNDARAHPIAGSGTGSYEQIWLRERPWPLDSRWAHSLYLEALGETGAIGLLLLGAALAAPLVAAVRSRSNPIVPAVFGAYVAYLVHAGVDWDWQVPALTLTALWCGCTLLATGDHASTWRLTRVRRAGVFATATAIGVLAVLGLAGNRDLALSHAYATRGEYPQAEAAAAAAARWQPWSYLPWMALGDARRASGDAVGAQLAYRRAIDHDPGRWDAWFALAEVSTGSQRNDALRDAVQLDPLSSEITEYCGSHTVSSCPGAPH